MTHEDFTKLPASERGNVPSPLVDYLDQQISSLENYITPFREDVNLTIINGRELQQREERLAYLRKIRGQLIHGQYSGIAEELQQDMAKTQGEMSRLQGNMQRTLEGD